MPVVLLPRTTTTTTTRPSLPHRAGRRRKRPAVPDRSLRRRRHGRRPSGGTLGRRLDDHNRHVAAVGRRRRRRRRRGGRTLPLRQQGVVRQPGRRRCVRACEQRLTHHVLACHGRRAAAGRRRRSRNPRRGVQGSGPDQHVRVACAVVRDGDGRVDREGADVLPLRDHLRHLPVGQRRRRRRSSTRLGLGQRHQHQAAAAAAATAAPVDDPLRFRIRHRHQRHVVVLLHRRRRSRDVALVRRVVLLLLLLLLLGVVAKRRLLRLQQPLLLLRRGGRGARVVEVGLHGDHAARQLTQLGLQVLHALGRPAPLLQLPLLLLLLLAQHVELRPGCVLLLPQKRLLQPHHLRVLLVDVAQHRLRDRRRRRRRRRRRHHQRRLPRARQRRQAPLPVLLQRRRLHGGQRHGVPRDHRHHERRALVRPRRQRNRAAARSPRRASAPRRRPRGGGGGGVRMVRRLRRRLVARMRRGQCWERRAERTRRHAGRGAGASPRRRPAGAPLRQRRAGRRPRERRRARRSLRGRRAEGRQPVVGDRRRLRRRRHTCGVDGAVRLAVVRVVLGRRRRRLQQRRRQRRRSRGVVVREVGGRGERRHRELAGTGVLGTLALRGLVDGLQHAVAALLVAGLALAVRLADDVAVERDALYGQRAAGRRLHPLGKLAGQLVVRGPGAGGVVAAVDLHQRKVVFVLDLQDQVPLRLSARGHVLELHGQHVLVREEALHVAGARVGQHHAVAGDGDDAALAALLGADLVHETDVEDIARDKRAQRLRDVRRRRGGKAGRLRHFFIDFFCLFFFFFVSLLRAAVCGEGFFCFALFCWRYHPRTAVFPCFFLLLFFEGCVCVWGGVFFCCFVCVCFFFACTQ